MWNLLCSKTIYIKEKKKVQTEDKKKTITTVATVRKKKKKAKYHTKALLPLQCLSSANTLSAQYRSTVAALLLFVYKKLGIPAVRAPPHLPCQTNLFSNFKPTLFSLFLSFTCFLKIYYYLLISGEKCNDYNLEKNGEYMGIHTSTYLKFTIKWIVVRVI